MSSGFNTLAFSRRETQYRSTSVPSAKIAFAKEGAKITQLTVADPSVMLTVRRE